MRDQEINSKMYVKVLSEHMNYPITSKEMEDRTRQRKKSLTSMLVYRLSYDCDCCGRVAANECEEYKYIMRDYRPGLNFQAFFS